MRCAPRASNGPYQLGLYALQEGRRLDAERAAVAAAGMAEQMERDVIESVLERLVNRVVEQDLSTREGLLAELSALRKVRPPPPNP